MAFPLTLVDVRGVILVLQYIAFGCYNIYCLDATLETVVINNRNVIMNSRFLIVIIWRC